MGKKFGSVLIFRCSYELRGVLDTQRRRFLKKLIESGYEKEKDYELSTFTRDFLGWAAGQEGLFDRFFADNLRQREQAIQQRKAGSEASPRKAAGDTTESGKDSPAEVVSEPPK